MEEPQRKEYAAVGLLTLATAALIASWIASGYRAHPVKAKRQKPPETESLSRDPWPTHAALATASQLQSSNNILTHAAPPNDYHDAFRPGLLGRDSPRLREAEIEADVSRMLASHQAVEHPSAHRSLNPLIDYVSRRPVGPIACRAFLPASCVRWLPPLANLDDVDQRLELVVLYPQPPRWTAGAARRSLALRKTKTPQLQTENWRLFGWDTIEPARKLGRWRGRVDLPELPTWNLSSPKQLAAQPEKGSTGEGPIISSPPSLAEPRVADSTERLAMKPRRKSNQPPRFELRPRNTPRPTKPAANKAADDAQQSAWISPTALLEKLHELAGKPATATWAIRVESLIRAIANAMSESESAEQTLQDLESARLDGIDLANELARQQTSAGLASELRRACHAIDRRASAWKIASELRAREASIRPVIVGSNQRLRERLLAVLNATAADSSQMESLSMRDRSDRWRRYLMTDRLSGLLEAPDATPIADRRRLAADIARRISSAVLTPSQRRFVESGPIAALGDELQVWGGPPTDTTQTLVSLEAYELSRSPRLAQRIVNDTRMLGASSTALHRDLAEQIEQKYRNANLRVAVSDQLLRRYLPPPQPTVEPVHTRIAGALVRGQAYTQTNLSVRLLPDPFVWRFGLEARGTVQSRTFANPGPVVFRNRSATTFLGRKLITVERRGMRTAPAVCEANSRMQLVGLSTDYDNVPLLGNVVRSRALDEQASRRPLARRQSENRVSTRVSRSLDEQSAPMLAKLKQRYSTSVLDRADALGLTVEPVELRTTQSRLIARMRVANDRQLAAHTPRNRAPSDSLASLQLHESVLNNMLGGLGVEGKVRTPAELQKLVQDRLQLPERPVEESEKKIKLLFASDEPLRIMLDGGRAELVLSIREMVVDRGRYKNFKVHAFYEPEAEGIEARLVRSGGIQIEGRMRAAKRVQLHGVFNQVFHEDRALPLLELPEGGEPRLAGLMVTQLVIGDGWLGLAIGPAADGQRVATVGKYVR